MPQNIKVLRLVPQLLKPVHLRLNYAFQNLLRGRQELQSAVKVLIHHLLPGPELLQVDQVSPVPGEPLEIFRV